MFNEDIGWVVHGRKSQGKEKGFYGMSANGFLVLTVHLQLSKNLRKLLGVLILGCILERWAIFTACARIRSW